MSYHTGRGLLIDKRKKGFKHCPKIGKWWEYGRKTERETSQHSVSLTANFYLEAFFDLDSVAYVSVWTFQAAFTSFALRAGTRHFFQFELMAERFRKLMSNQYEVFHLIITC
jgi:hypothetical protein